jgi:hypothetical protein
MTEKPTVIIVNVVQQRDWYIATSDDLRELIVTYPSFDTIVKQLPETIRLLYKSKGFDVVVQQAETPGIHPAGQFRYITEKRAA